MDWSNNLTAIMFLRHTRTASGRMAELVDALASGASGSNTVRVQVPLRPPRKKPLRIIGGFLRAP